MSFVDAVYEPGSNQHLFVYVLPVDHADESGDGTGVAVSCCLFV